MKYLEQGRFVLTDESVLFFFLAAAAISRRVVADRAVKSKKARFSAGWRFSWSWRVMAAVVLVVYDGGRARFAGSTVGSSWLSGPLRRRWRVSLPPASVIASARKNCEILRMLTRGRTGDVIGCRDAGRGCAASRSAEMVQFGHSSKHYIAISITITMNLAPRRTAQR